MKWQRLNHPLTDKSPQYGSNPPVQAELATSIQSGAASNTHIIHLHNHSGTHVDAPRHFRDDGLTVADFPEDFWVFEKIFLLDLPKKPDMLITAEDIEQHHKNIKACELLLIRTGYERYRSSTPDFYRFHNPGITPEAARVLRSYSDEFILIEDLHLAGIKPPDVVILEPVFRMAIDATPVIVVAVYKSVKEGGE